jgi:hypothetical protein
MRSCGLLELSAAVTVIAFSPRAKSRLVGLESVSLSFWFVCTWTTSVPVGPGTCLGALFWNGSVGFASEEELRKSTRSIEVPIRPKMARELVSLVDFAARK